MFRRARLESEERFLHHETSARAIREGYEDRFPVPKEEHPGGRIDFFVQVDYAIKAAGVVLSVCCIAGMWFAGKAIRAR